MPRRQNFPLSKTLSRSTAIESEGVRILGRENFRTLYDIQITTYWLCPAVDRSSQSAAMVYILACSCYPIYDNHLRDHLLGYWHFAGLPWLRDAQIGSCSENLGFGVGIEEGKQKLEYTSRARRPPCHRFTPECHILLGRSSGYY